MSRDPYVDAKSDVEASINNVGTLLESYRRIQATSNDSLSLIEAKGELQSALQLLETDLADLDESVHVVEQHGDRWGLAHAEVAERRAFVNSVSSEVARLKTAVGEASRTRHTSLTPYRDDDGSPPNDDYSEAERWEREEQQDDTLGFISGTLSTLASQAGLIGQEVAEHSEMLDDLSTRVDSTHSRLSRVSRTMKDFIRKNESGQSSWNRS
ncbi:hypothetical protein CspeluHIS016_0703450 [Cutaneotrichosporon spelunceum]|uniref:t-SNARE coiled-coil homology domain-containing protein n=1 Tax=Cutaneotrichosporon spelunceum TaxID=1672016 RepID=A0AAD3YDL4_9TREE|nr:hypothetical protein CspeluHIS016_0703450 [Cutaneotrichosporon spelunceum]